MLVTYCITWECTTKYRYMPVAPRRMIPRDTRQWKVSIFQITGARHRVLPIRMLGFFVAGLLVHYSLQYSIPTPSRIKPLLSKDSGEPRHNTVSVVQDCPSAVKTKPIGGPRKVCASTFTARRRLDDDNRWDASGPSSQNGNDT
jgi:hypothetical protein